MKTKDVRVDPGYCAAMIRFGQTRPIKERAAVTMTTGTVGSSRPHRGHGHRLDLVDHAHPSTTLPNTGASVELLARRER